MYTVVYTLALPLAGVMGVLVPSSALRGDDDIRWGTMAIAQPAAVAVLAPVMVSLHPLLISSREWAKLRNWSGMLLQFLIDTVDPHKYHGRECENREISLWQWIMIPGARLKGMTAIHTTHLIWTSERRKFNVVN